MFSKRTLAAAARLVRRILRGALLADAVVAAASNAAPRRCSRRTSATPAGAAKGSCAATAQGGMGPARVTQATKLGGRLPNVQVEMQLEDPTAGM